jgi:hypothetical protein
VSPTAAADVDRGALDIVLPERRPGPDKQRRYQMARDSCKRLQLIVDDLLEVAAPTPAGVDPPAAAGLTSWARGRALSRRAQLRSSSTSREECASWVTPGHQVLSSDLNAIVHPDRRPDHRRGVRPG